MPNWIHRQLPRFVRMSNPGPVAGLLKLITITTPAATVYVADEGRRE